MQTSTNPESAALWFKRIKHWLLAFATAIPAISIAVPIGDIDVGETYYINNILKENDLVIVRRIDERRRLVKIEYMTGGVDWVSPESLYTRTGSRNADVEEAIVGTALVAGTLWAIFDPDGFQRAMASNNTNRPHSNQGNLGNSNEARNIVKNTINISAVPFSPAVHGDWLNQGKQWIDWAETSLNNELGKFVDIESVRTKQIPFYSTPTRNVILAEAVQTGRTGAYYIIAVVGQNTQVVLNGNGGPIHTMNKQMGLSIESATAALEYLKFFTSAISADDGIFVILEPQADYLSKNAHSELKTRPISVRKKDGGAWSISSDIIYGSEIFEAEFLVHRNGNVEMISDSFKRKILFDYRVVMDGPRRVYVSQR